MRRVSRLTVPVIAAIDRLSRVTGLTRGKTEKCNVSVYTGASLTNHQCGRNRRCRPLDQWRLESCAVHLETQDLEPVLSEQEPVRETLGGYRE